MRLRHVLFLVTSMPLLGCAAEPGSSDVATGGEALAPGNTYTATDAASFNALIADPGVVGGDTIVLVDGEFPALSVTGRTYGPESLNITGSPSAVVHGLTVATTSGIHLSGFTIKPTCAACGDVSLTIKGASSAITVDGLIFQGIDVDQMLGQYSGAFIDTKTTASDITIQNTQFNLCGKGNACVSLGASNLVIQNNDFVEQHAGDFIKGGGRGAMIIGNRFGSSNLGTCVPNHPTFDCPHTDQIQLMGSGPFTIESNHFGSIGAGAAQLFLNSVNCSDPLHDVVVRNNIFWKRNDNTFAIRIHTGDWQRPPPTGCGQVVTRDVWIVGNTVLAGSTSSIYFSEGWDTVGPTAQPSIANNILARQGAASCRRGRFHHNLSEPGAEVCPNDVASMDEGNQLGASNLDEGLDGSGTFAPLAPNPLVIDAADPSATHAPITDFYGAPRGSAPDRGAVEYRPPDPAPVYIQSTGARGLSSAPSATYALSPAPGDLLVAAIGVNGAPTINCPAGWTTASVVANGTSVAQAICTKVAGAGEPAQVLASLSTSRNWQMAIAEYRNATVKDQQESATGSSSMLSSGTTPTPTAASELFVALISNRNTDVQSPPGNGFVARYQAQNGTGTNGVSVTYADKIVASQEAAGTFTTVPQARPFVGAVVTFMR